MPGCETTYVYKETLIDHLKKIHGKDFEEEEQLVFARHEDFMKWKDEIEKNTMSYYSMQSGEKKNRYSYYICQHDGSAKCHSKPKTTSSKKQPNFKGRMKTGNMCLSMLKVRKEIDNSVHVKYFPSHCHPLDKSDLKHQPISKDTNNYINSLICLGVSPKKIIHDMKEDKISRVNRSEEMQYLRDDFLSLKSLSERKRKFITTSKILAADNSNSTMPLVKKLKKESFSPILQPVHKIHTLYLKKCEPVKTVQPSSPETSSSSPHHFSQPSSPETLQFYSSSKPSQLSNNSSTMKNQKTKNTMLELSKQLVEQIENNRVPQNLAPHITGVLSQLLAELT